MGELSYVNLATQRSRVMGIANERGARCVSTDEGTVRAGRDVAHRKGSSLYLLFSSQT